MVQLDKLKYLRRRPFSPSLSFETIFPCKNPHPTYITFPFNSPSPNVHFIPKMPRTSLHICGHVFTMRSAGSTAAERAKRRCQQRFCRSHTKKCDRLSSSRVAKCNRRHQQKLALTVEGYRSFKVILTCIHFVYCIFHF